MPISEIQIQSLKNIDLPDIRSIYCAAWQQEFGSYLKSPLRAQEIENRFNRVLQPASGLVAAIKDRPVGYLIFTPVSPGAEMNQWYVSPSWQGQGVGGQLFSQLLCDFSGQIIEWWAWENNQRAKQAYSKMGATLSGRRKTELVGGALFRYQHWQITAE